jgi:hypothetical protein
MKKGLLGLVVAALTIVGCQNYDDQFDDLNTKIATLQNSVNDLDGITAAVTDLGSRLTALEGSVLTDADLVQILDDVAAVQTAVDDIDVSGIEAEVTDLENEVDEILERLNELLAANAVIMGDIVIRNEGDLLVAEDLIGTEADDPLVTVQGNVLIEITGTSSITEAANVARVNAVMAKLKIVQGTVTVTTSKALSLPELMYVSNDFHLTQNTGGSAPSAKLRTINGTFNFTGGGDVNYSQLANAAGVNITTNAVTLTSIDFGGLGGSGKVLTGTNSLVLPNALSVRVGGVLPEVVTLAKATSFESTYSGAAQTTSTIHVGGAAATFSINSTKFTGAVSITSTGDVNLANVTSVKGLTVTASDTANLSGITAFTAQATLTAADVDVSAWKSNTHTITINTDTTISAPALTTLTGGLIASSATVFDAPKLKTTTGTIDLKNNAKLTVHLESMDATTPTATILEWANVSVLKVTKQKGTTALDVSQAVSLTSLDYTGAEVTPKASGAQSNSLTLTASNTKLVTLKLGGYLGSFTASNTKLKSVDTTGAFIVTTNFTNNTALTGLTFAHSHIQGDDASDVIIKNNDKITTLDLSSLAKVQTVEVTGNDLLTSIVAPSTSVLATSVATITVTISDNKLSGAYTTASAPTGTVSYRPATISGAALTSFKPWIEANVNVDLNAPFGTKDRTLTGSASSTSTASGNAVIYNIDLDSVTTDGGTTTSTLSAALDADNAASLGPDTTAATADDQNDNNVNTGSGVSTKNELDSVI